MKTKLLKKLRSQYKKRFRIRRVKMGGDIVFFAESNIHTGNPNLFSSANFCYAFFCSSFLSNEQERNDCNRSNICSDCRKCTKLQPLHKTINGAIAQARCGVEYYILQYVLDEKEREKDNIASQKCDHLKL
jgi:hypothetical protein